MAVLLTAVVVGTGITARLTDSRGSVLSGVASSPADGVSGIIMSLLIVFFSFFSGGYVAGRMARFNGAGQGLMVWLWAVVTAGVVAVLSMVTGTRLDVFPTGAHIPGILLFEGQITTSHLIAIIVAAAVALMGAALGGTAGMHYHRKVDRAGFTPAEDDNAA